MLERGCTKRSENEMVRESNGKQGRSKMTEFVVRQKTSYENKCDKKSDLKVIKEDKNEV